MKEKIIISITSIIGFMLLCLQLNELRTEASLSNYLTYTNTGYGFTIKYPNDWRVDEANPAGITFHVPDNSAKVIVHKTSNMSVEELIRAVESRPTNSSAFRIIELDNNKYFLSGHPAIRWVIMSDVLYPDGSIDEVKVMYYATNVGNDVFDIGYDSSPEKFSDFLNSAQTMIDSFQIISKE